MVATRISRRNPPLKWDAVLELAEFEAGQEREYWGKFEVGAITPAAAFSDGRRKGARSFEGVWTWRKFLASLGGSGVSDLKLPGGLQRNAAAKPEPSPAEGQSGGGTSLRRRWRRPGSHPATW